MKTNRDAFTLAELLIVIAIIVVLAALLMPAFRGIQESGRMTKCASNLHQLQIAAMNYAANSSDGKLPPAVTYSCVDAGDYTFNPQDTWVLKHGWVSWAGWTPASGKNTKAVEPSPSPGHAWSGTNGLACIRNGSLFGYVGNEVSVFLCPSFAQNKVCNVSDARRAYSMNSDVSEASIYDTKMGAAQTTPGQTKLFGDDATLIGNATADSGFTPATDLGTWHRNTKGNVVYLDGHVQRLP